MGDRQKYEEGNRSRETGELEREGVKQRDRETEGERNTDKRRDGESETQRDG